jgi:hypothetical protein
MPSTPLNGIQIRIPLSRLPAMRSGEEESVTPNGNTRTMPIPSPSSLSPLTSVIIFVEMDQFLEGNLEQTL